MANCITSIRILCAFFLVFVSPLSIPFYVLYIIGGISDVFDGIVAKHFDIKTKFGARFDTIADILFFGVILIKLINIIYAPLWIYFWIICIAVVKLTNAVNGFITHKRFVVEHTILNRVCGFLLFAVPFCIGWFPWIYTMLLVCSACTVATVATIQEGYYIHKGIEIA